MTQVVTAADIVPCGLFQYTQLLTAFVVRRMIDGKDIVVLLFLLSYGSVGVGTAIPHEKSFKFSQLLVEKKV